MFHTASTLQLRSDLPTEGLCGPRALRNVLRAMGVRGARLDVLARVVPGARGTSLATLASLAASIGAPMRCVWCPRGAALPGLAVAHCEPEHFVAWVPSERDDDDASGVLSGYLLVPWAMPFDPRWREVGALEASRVWGRGNTILSQLGRFGRGDLLKPPKRSCGLARYDFHGMLAALHVEDTPVWIRAPFGPQLVFTVSYNQADVYSRNSPLNAGLGPRWTHNWHQYIRLTHREGELPGSTDVVAHLFQGGGGVQRYVFREGEAIAQRPQESTSALHRDPATGTTARFVLRHQDASSETYAEWPGGPSDVYVLIQVSDPQGNEARLFYSTTRALTDFALEAVVDALGQRMEFVYASTSPTSRQLGEVRVLDRRGNPRGTATFVYAHERLVQIEDMARIRSTFGYQTAARGLSAAEAEALVAEHLGMADASADSDFMRWMRTPYGETRFQTGWRMGTWGEPNERWIEATSPNGDTERVESRWVPSESTMAGDGAIPAVSEQDALGAPSSVHAALAPLSLDDLPDPKQAQYLRDHDPNQQLDRFNTFHWTPRAYRRAGGASPRVVGAESPPDSATPPDRRLDHRYASIIHWMRELDPLHRDERRYRANGVVASTLTPGENRVWYQYKEQSYALELTASPALPECIARHLPASTPRPPEDSHVRYEYDNHARIIASTDPMGRRTEVSYVGAEGADITAIRQKMATESLDLVTRFERYNALHLPELIVDAANEPTRILYNRHGQPLLITRPDASEVWFRYEIQPEGAPTIGGRPETWGNLVEIHTPAGRSTFEYNGRNLVEHSVDPDGTTRTFSYDPLDRLTQIDYADGTFESISYQRRDPATGLGLVFDADARVVPEDASAHAESRRPVVALEWTKTVDRDGKEVSRAFDPQRRLTRIATGDTITRFEYPDLSGAVSNDLLRMIDGSGHVTTWRQRNDVPALARFDDRAVEMERPDRTVTRYSYDEQGRPWRIEALAVGRSTEVVYLADGRPFTQTATQRRERAIQRFEYDPFVPRMTRARHFTLNVDTLVNELVDDVQLLYTPQGFHGAGRLMLSLHARTGVNLAYTYDELGRLKTRATIHDRVPSNVLELEYGGNGLVRSTTDVLGASLFCYNDRCDDAPAEGATDASRLSQVTLPDGALLRIRYASEGAGRGSRLSAYELRTSPTLVSPGVLRHRVAVGFTAAGRRSVESQQIRFDESRSASWERAYSDDAAGRLSDVEHRAIVDGRPLFLGDDEYRYDPSGNLHIETNTGTGRDGRVVELRNAVTRYDEGDRLQSRTVAIQLPVLRMRTESAWVDEAGCTRSDGQANYEWDVLDRLRSVSRGPDGAIRSDFGRDVFGRVSWIRDARGTRDLVWDGLTLLEERDAETHEVIRAYAASGFTQRGARYYYLRDPLGSVVGLMDQNNDVVKTWIYDAWGFRALSWQAEGMEEVEPAIGYAGYLQHEESGLCLMPARAYNPALRRWLSRDPIGLAGGDTNLYGYVANNPVYFSDPSGLIAVGPILLAVAIGAGLGLVGGGYGGSNTGGFNWHSAWRGALMGGVGGLVAPLIAAYVPASGVAIGALTISRAALTVGTWGLGGLAGGIAGEVYDVVHGPPRGNCPIDGEFDLSGLEIGTFSGLVGGWVGSVAGLRDAASPLLPGLASAAVDSTSNVLQALRAAFP